MGATIKPDLHEHIDGLINNITKNSTEENTESDKNLMTV